MNKKGGGVSINGLDARLQRYSNRSERDGLETRKCVPTRHIRPDSDTAVAYIHTIVSRGIRYSGC